MQKGMERVSSLGFSDVAISTEDKSVTALIFALINSVTLFHVQLRQNARMYVSVASPGI